MSVEIRLEQSKFKDKKGAGKWYARTGKKNQTLAYGARVEWAEPEYDDEDDD